MIEPRPGKAGTAYCWTCREERKVTTDRFNPLVEWCTICGRDAWAEPIEEDRRPANATEIEYSGYDHAPLWSETKFVFEEVIVRQRIDEAWPEHLQSTPRGKKAARRAEARRQRKLGEARIKEES